MINVYASRVVITDGFFHNTNLSGAFLVGAKIDCAASQEYDSQPIHEMTSKYDCISNTNFENANLSHAHLLNLDLYNSKVENVKFTMARVIKSILPQEINADFSGAVLPATQFRGDLSNVIFSCHYLWCTDFSPKVFATFVYDMDGYTALTGEHPNSDGSPSESYAIATDLSYTDLSKKDLSKVVFSTINDAKHFKNTVKLNFSNLSKSIFSGNNLVNVDFTEADLTFSDLSDTNMSHANLEGANLEGANLSGVSINEETILKCKNHPICNSS